MGAFLFIIFPLVIIWFLFLFLLRPKLSDLKTKKPSRWESFTKIQATFWLGIVLIVVLLIVSDGTFYQITNNWLAMFGLNNVKIFTPWWFIQSITHNFISVDPRHLLGYLGLLGFLSLYERNVGPKRFLTIFLFSGILSSILVLFISNPIIYTGAFAGLFGLCAAYFLDNPKLTLKGYIGGIIVVLIFGSFLVSPEYGQTLYIVMLGVFFGIVYCKLFPRKTEKGVPNY